MKTTTQNHEFQVNLLITLILLFVIAFSVFFILTYVNRYKRIKKVKLKAIYQKSVDEMLFELLFDENVTIEIASNSFKQQYEKNQLFKKITIKSINALHRNYTGELKEKIEEFYVKSGLVNYSLKKINSPNWARTVEAIRDLSNLNYQPAYDNIYSKLKHSKKNVQKEAFIGIILLKGLEELLQLKETKLYLDDWTQSNILYVVKRDRMHAPENIAFLLKSTNETIAVLGARIIQYFQLNQHIPALEDCIQNNPNSKIGTKLIGITNQLKNSHE